MKNKFDAFCLVFMIFVTLLNFASIIVNFSSKAETKRLYPLSTMIVEVNEEADEVIAEDFNGHQWAFEGTEDWMVGDLCALMMDCKGTEDIRDDEIITARYCGYVG